MSRNGIWSVPGISCEHCAMRIRNALAKVAGVRDVSVDVDAKSVRLTCVDAAAASRAQEALIEAGYPPADA